MKIILSLLALFVLSGCAETELASHLYKTWPEAPQQQGNFKVGNPYKVEGQWYTPRETYSYSETGIASWYGPGFNGQRTANGERFDKNELTAAHRTLQMPSLVRVTNLDNGRSLVVRVNDRGPFRRSRVIDVSEKAAELLGFKNIGTAKVRLDLLTDESRVLAMAARRGESTSGAELAMNQAPGAQAVLTSPEAAYQPVSAEPLAPPAEIPGHVKNGAFFPDAVVSQQPVHPTSIYIQAGSFSQAGNAAAMAQKLAAFGKAQVYPADVGGRSFFRVRLGPVPNVNAADALLARVSGAGYKQAIIVVD